MIEAGFSLLRKRQFLPLFLTQFFGAFNDNAFKLSMLTLISYHLTTLQSVSEHYQALAAALFTIPFFIFSATAGQLADRYDKSKMTVIIKVAEVFLMVLGALGLYYGKIWLLLVVLTGMGIHSTFFGPIKYAILPDHLERSELMSATALIEASTFLAILLGTTLGTLSIGSEHPHPMVAIGITFSMAILGLAASFFIPKTPERARHLVIDWHLWRATKNMLKEVLMHEEVRPAIFAISWFWLIGAVMLTKLPDYIHYILHAKPSVFAFFLSLFSIGIGLGSLAISVLMKGRITIRYVPYCMLLLSFFAYDLFSVTPESSNSGPLITFLGFIQQGLNLRIALDFFLFSFCCGLFTVPLYAFLQVCCDNASRARTIAANNIINALFMVFGSIFVMLLLYFKITMARFFLLLALMNGVATVIMCVLLYYQAQKTLI